MRKTVKVTATGIKRGIPRSFGHCPISRACRAIWARKFNGVSETHLVFNTPGFWLPLPMKARRFIERFDAGMSVKPFSFSVVAPDA